ncbi:MAG: rubrerythrin family protein [Kosmotoga sp.]|nr:MAG: rubrerythrin family protein [Kosmotoga sp.]
MDKRLREALIAFQMNEITEYHIYMKLSNNLAGENRDVLRRIANDEKKHYDKWKEHSGKTVKPSKLKIFWYLLIAKIFGMTFALKALEGNEESAQEKYYSYISDLPDAEAIMEDENEHEKELLNMLDEERINYISSMVLGLNDALVELTGALAGLTLAIQNTAIVALSGFITGMAAALSMGASEYLSKKSDVSSDKHPLKSALYTGITYLVTVIILIMPYLLIPNILIALGITLIAAVLIILAFTYFVSVVKERSFKKAFFEMFSISMGVAAVSFVVGLVIREVFNVNI